MWKERESKADRDRRRRYYFAQLDKRKKAAAAQARLPKNELEQRVYQGNPNGGDPIVSYYSRDTPTGIFPAL